MQKRGINTGPVNRMQGGQGEKNSVYLFIGQTLISPSKALDAPFAYEPHHNFADIVFSTCSTTRSDIPWELVLEAPAAQIW